MQSMLKVPFERFLVKLLCQFINDNNKQSSKFHFESADPQRATMLYNSFRYYADKKVPIDGAPIYVITTDKNHQILVMLHRDGEQNDDTYNEDFIANVRDELNKLDNASLVVIHNSSLDSILTSFQNLNTKGQIFTPESIKEALEHLIKTHDHQQLMQILLSHRERKIIEENLSIFAYEYLYNSIINNTVDFYNEGLFRDSRLFDLTNKNEIEGDIKGNARLYSVIDKYVSDFSNSEVELKEKLEEIGLGEKFIKDNFFDSTQPLKWKELEYRYLLDEIDKNKHCLLDIENIEYNSKKLTTYKHGGDTGARYKRISIIIEADSENVELKIRMTKGKPLLSSEQIKISGDYNDSQITLRPANHEKQTTLTASFIFDGTPKFLKIKFGRPSVKENFQFNILIVPQKTFNFYKYFEKVTIDIERNKGKVLLENIVEPICISTENTIEKVVEHVDEIINFEEVGTINLQQLLENEVSTTLIFQHNNIQLPVSVTGSVTLDPIKLPSILDAQRGITIFESDRIPKYNAKTKRAIVAGKEKALNVDAQILCNIEYEIVHQELLTWDENQRPKLMQKLATCYPTVASAYQELFTWLRTNETILSITNWPADLRKCVHNVVQAVIDALEQIPNGSLTSEQRELLEVGIYKGTINKQEGAYEWLTPYHPLCLSYALELANKLSITNDQSISQIPSTTLNKLTPAGLLPILVDDKQEYSFTEAHSHNKLWLKIIPQKQNNPSFVKELVSEKIKDFMSCFEMLFKQNEYAPLLINSIYNQDNEFIFKGIVDYLEKNKNNAKYIHVNIFDDNLYNTFFDQFSEIKEINQLRNIIKLSPQKQDITDELIALIREKVSYSKFVNKTDYSYAHLSFFKNNEKVKVTNRPTPNTKTGVTCQGFISGEASYLENNNYYSGFGLRGLQEENNLIKLAERYNELLIPYKNKSDSYIKGVVKALAVHDQFKEKLTHSYDSSIWTCIIDPKVTLDFFDDANTILIHYSDHYTNSSSYDAITVSSRVSLYKSLLNKESDELLNSFNAISGQWLLEIVKASGKKTSDATAKQIKEKQGIIAAYKFLASFLLKSKITWVPLPIAELIRVTGSLGLGFKDNDFSARLHNKRLGAMCDDILFVGFANNEVYLLPLEVKNREKGTDFTKAVSQAKELGKYMKELLAASSFKGQIYRSLFVQHVVSQIERFQLYNVFPADYFTSIILRREIYQQGEYQISEIKNYPVGIALALNNNRETAKLEVKLDGPSNILQIQLPLGLSEYLQNQPIVDLANKVTDILHYPELKHYILTDYESTPFMVNNDFNLETTSSVIDEINSEELTIMDETYSEDISSPTVSFDYPDNYQEIIDLLLEKLDDDLTKNDLLNLTESDFINLLGDKADLLTFFRLKEYVIQQNENSLSSNDLSPKLTDLNIDQNFSALINLLIQRFGDTISINEVLALEDNSLLQLNGFGKAKLGKFAELKEYLKQHKFSLKSSALRKKAPLIEDFDIAIDELEQKLILSLENFLDSAQGREIDIFKKRFGIYCDCLTLEEIGSDYGVTRERIRQIESKAKKNFLSYLTVSQKVIQAIIKSNLSELREPLFQSLRAYFVHDKNFYSFIELCCGLLENEIKQIINPKISQNYFNEFWINHISPAQLDDLTWYLHETLNIEQAVAENQILRWLESDLLTLDDRQQISPKKLPKVEALTNALLEFPNGGSWKCIQQRVIEKKITLAEITSERLDPALTTAVDKEYIYQSDRGTYRHLNYLQLSYDEIELVLTRVKEKIKEYQFEGRNAVNLSVDIYQNSNFSQDYFITRHIVRAYGSNIGIYFNGKSGTDTVSLNAEFDLVSQRKVLLELFKRTIHPLTKRDIADKIRSQSLGHAAFYLDILLNEGEVVRVSESEFAHKDKAFKDVNIDNIMELVCKLFNNEDRIIEGEVLQTYLNRKLSLQSNKYFYLSLLKIYAEKYRLTLYFVQNLVAKFPIKQSGLVDFCRDALSKTKSNSEAIKLIQQSVLANTHIIKRALLQCSFPQVNKNENEIESSIIEVHTEFKDEIVIPVIPETDRELIMSDSVENTRVLLGKSIDNFEDIYWEYGNKNLANRHLIVFGRSGQGKTYCIQGILMELAKSNHNSLIIDYTNGFLPNQLETEFNKFIQPTSHYLAQKPLGISPFRKQKQDYGGVVLEEQNHIVAARITSVFNQVYSSIGEQQFATLTSTIEAGLKSYGQNYDFEHLYNDLINEEKRGEALANKLAPMMKSNLFDASKNQGWENIFSNKQSRTTIIQLASLSRDIMRIATEFSLWDLYAYACSYGNKNKPLPIILDEVQNLDHKLDSPLGKMLTEGRKYGISLILATQTLSVLKGEEQDRLFQAAHKLFFAPAETEILNYAKLLEQAIPGTDKKVWSKELANLQKGECISVGLHKDHYGKITTSARTIKIANLESRLV